MTESAKKHGVLQEAVSIPVMTGLSRISEDTIGCQDSDKPVGRGHLLQAIEQSMLEGTVAPSRR